MVAADNPAFQDLTTLLGSTLRTRMNLPARAIALQSNPNEIARLACRHRVFLMVYTAANENGMDDLASLLAAEFHAGITRCTFLDAVGTAILEDFFAASHQGLPI